MSINPLNLSIANLYPFAKNIDKTTGSSLSSDSVEESPKNSFDQDSSCEPFFDDSYLIVLLSMKMKKSTISLKSVLEDEIEKYCEKDASVGIIFIKFVSEKLKDIEPWMWPKIFAVLKKTSALEKKSDAESFSCAFDFLANDVYELAHAFFQNYHHGIFSSFLPWWMDMITANSELAISLFRNFGYTDFIPLLKEKNFTDEFKSSVLLCLYLTERSLYTFYGSVNSLGSTSLFDRHECHVINHPDLFAALSDFIRKKNLNHEDCHLLIKLLNWKSIPLQGQRQDSSYDEILEKVCDTILLYKNVKIKTTLYFSLCEFIMNGKKNSKGFTDKFEDIQDDYRGGFEIKRDALVADLDSQTLTKRKLVALFESIWLYGHREENEERLLLAFKAMIEVLEKLDPIALELNYSSAIAEIIDLCRKRGNVSPKEFRFFHQLAFSSPSIFMQQGLSLGLELFLFLPYLKLPETFGASLEALGAISRAFVKNQVDPYTIEINDYLNPDEQKKVVECVLDLSMKRGKIAWCGSVFLCSMSPSLRALVLKEQGGDFSLYHQLQVASLSRQIKEIAPAVEKRIKKLHGEAFWSRALQTRDPLLCVTVLRFFVPFLPYTEIHRVLRDIDTLELRNEIVIQEIPHIFLKLLSSKDAVAVGEKELLTTACFSINFFFKKEYAFPFNNKSSLSVFGFAEKPEKLSVSRASMESGCVIPINAPIAISAENIKLLKRMYFLLTTGSCEEKVDFAKKMFCTNRALPNFFAQIFYSMMYIDLPVRIFILDKVFDICELASTLIKDVSDEERGVNWFEIFLKAESLFLDKAFLLRLAMILSSKKEQKNKILSHKKEFIEAFNAKTNPRCAFKIMNDLKKEIPDYWRWRAISKVFKVSNDLFFSGFLEDQNLSEECLVFFSSLDSEIFKKENFVESYTYLLLRAVEKGDLQIFFEFLPFFDQTPISLIMPRIFAFFSEDLFDSDDVKPLVVYCFARAELEDFSVAEHYESIIVKMNIAISRPEIYSYAFQVRYRKALLRIEETKKKLFVDIDNLNYVKQKNQHKLLCAVETLKNLKKREEDLFVTLAHSKGCRIDIIERESEFKPLVERISHVDTEIQNLRQTALKTLKEQLKHIEREDQDTIYGGLEEVCFTIREACKPGKFFLEVENQIVTASSKERAAIKAAAFYYSKDIFSKVVRSKTEVIKRTAIQVETIAHNFLQHLEALECENIEKFTFSDDTKELNFDELENEIQSKEKTFAKQVANAIGSEPNSESEKLKSFQLRIEEQNSKLKAIAKDNEALEHKVKDLESKTPVSLKNGTPISDSHDEDHTRMVEKILSLNNVLERFKELTPVAHWEKNQIEEWKKIAVSLGEIEKSVSQNLHHHRNLEITKLWKVMGLFGFQITTHEGSHYKVSHPAFSDINETIVYHANKQVPLYLVKSCYSKMAAVLQKWIHVWTLP